MAFFKGGLVQIFRAENLNSPGEVSRDRPFSEVVSQQKKGSVPLILQILRDGKIHGPGAD